jgi:hypothetical protein
VVENGSNDLIGIFPELMNSCNSVVARLIGAFVRRFPFAFPDFRDRLMAICKGAEQEVRLAFMTDLTLYQTNDYLSDLLRLFQNYPDHSVRDFLRVCRYFQLFELIGPFHAVLDDDTEFLEALADIVMEDEEFASRLRPFPLQNVHSSAEAIAFVVAVLDSVAAETQEPWIEMGVQQLEVLEDVEMDCALTFLSRVAGNRPDILAALCNDPLSPVRDVVARLAADEGTAVEMALILESIRD